MDHKKEINKKPNLNVSSISVSSLEEHSPFHVA